MIRPVVGLDRDAIFALRNDADSIRYSVTGPIADAEKDKWFARCISYARLFFVDVVGDHVRGYVRVDQTAEISVAVAHDARRQGVARALIETAVEKFPGELRAIVHADNAPSLALFRACGFDEGPEWAGKEGPWRIFTRAKAGL